MFGKAKIMYVLGKPKKVTTIFHCFEKLKYRNPMFGQAKINPEFRYLEMLITEFQCSVRPEFLCLEKPKFQYLEMPKSRISMIG